MSEKTNVVNNENAEPKKEQAAPVESQDQGSSDVTPQTPEVKHTFFSKVDQWFVDRRSKREAKKAKKTPMSKAKKAAIAGGVTALVLGGVGLAGKSLYKRAERYVEDYDDETDGTEGLDQTLDNDSGPTDVELSEANETTNTEET